MELPGYKLKLLVSSIIFLFIVQEVLTDKYIAEPYPALKMPPFSGNRMNDEGFYEITNAEIKIIFTKEEDLILSPSQLFYNAPKSYHGTFLKKFKPSKKRNTQNYYDQLNFLKPVFTGFFISRNRSRYEVQHHPQTLQWLRNQVAEFSPGRRPDKILFIWYKNQFFPDNIFTYKRELTDTTTIIL